MSTRHGRVVAQSAKNAEEEAYGMVAVVVMGRLGERYSAPPSASCPSKEVKRRGVAVKILNVRVSVCVHNL